MEMENEFAGEKQTYATYAPLGGQNFAGLFAAGLAHRFCAASPETTHLSVECRQGIDAAYEELDYAASKGFDGSVAWMKAASLLVAAKTQLQFEKYPNCIEKVQRARLYIRQSQQ
jgi:hypothetical protein